MRHDFISGEARSGSRVAARREKQKAKPGASEPGIENATDPRGRIESAERRIRVIQKLRRKRGELFDPDLFAEPAWEMLLELYLSEITDRPIAVSSLCASALVPATTALRWIWRLETGGWAERHTDPNDGRRIFISLTERGRESMERFLALVDFQSVG